MNGMTPPLYPFPLAFQPVYEASCRPPSPQQKPGVFASHVGGGGRGDCQSSADIPCNVVGGGLSIQVSNVALTTVVADQSEARTQSPEDVAKMALASDVVVVQVSRQLPMPRGRSPSTDPRKVAQHLTRERQPTVREGNAAAVSVDESPAYNDHEHTGDSSWTQLTSITARQRGPNHAAPLPLTTHL